MAETNIEWTHFPGYAGATWNPVIGCAKIAAGCKSCYAEKMSKRLAAMGQRDYASILTPDGRFSGRAITRPQTLDVPLRRRKPTCWFVNSMSDLFHDDVPFEFIAACYGVMAACPQHLFIILTKRPKRMREFMGWLDKNPEYQTETCAQRALLHDNVRAASNPNHYEGEPPEWPIPNVIHGYSIAHQPDTAGIADLLATPSALRCLSIEPLIGPVMLTDTETCEACNGEGFFWAKGGGPSYVKKHGTGRDGDPIRHKVACEDCGGGFDGPGTGTRETFPEVDWVIVGGESGDGARPFDIAWARDLRDQCKAAGVPFFLKQVGSNPRGHAQWEHPDNEGRGVDPELSRLTSRKGGDPSEWPSDLRIREFPKEPSHAH